MPVSKNRRKNGKKVIRGRHNRRMARDAEIREINRQPLTLQDLINVVALQDHVKKEGAIVTSDTKVHIPDEVPLNIGEGDEKREIGSVSRIPGDEEHASVHITDPEILKKVQGPLDHLSIAEENPKIDFNDPNAQAVVKAAYEASIEDEPEHECEIDECHGQNSFCQENLKETNEHGR